MIKNKLIPAGITIGVLLLFMATLNYPGGSNLNELTTGYDWINNYLSNLLNPTAVNGMHNTARPWAIGGILLLSASFGAFFIKFSQKIPDKSAAFIIKYLGIAATGFAFLTAIPSLHDIMVTISSILTLIIFFYITVFVLKSKLRTLKILSVLFLATFYLGAYMYFTQSYLVFMPIMQKVIFAVKIIWILALNISRSKRISCLCIDRFRHYFGVIINGTQNSSKFIIIKAYKIKACIFGSRCDRAFGKMKFIQFYCHIFHKTFQLRPIARGQDHGFKIELIAAWKLNSHSCKSGKIADDLDLT